MPKSMSATHAGSTSAGNLCHLLVRRARNVATSKSVAPVILRGLSTPHSRLRAVHEPAEFHQGRKSRSTLADLFTRAQRGVASRCHLHRDSATTAPPARPVAERSAPAHFEPAAYALQGPISRAGLRDGERRGATGSLTCLPSCRLPALSGSPVSDRLLPLSTPNRSSEKVPRNGSVGSISAPRRDKPDHKACAAQGSATARPRRFHPTVYHLPAWRLARHHCELQDNAREGSP